MDQRTDDIRQDIEATRAALGEKLDTLESRARQTFDLKHQVSERPWVAFGAAVAVGYALGSMGGGGQEERWHGQPVTTTDYNQHATGRSDSSTQRYSKRTGDSFLSQFDDEIEMLKGAAISTITTLLRDTIREFVPAMSQHMDQAQQNQGRPSTTAAHSEYYSETGAAHAAGDTGLSSPSGSYSRSGNAGDREYVKTYHPASETERERTAGNPRSY